MKKSILLVFCMFLLSASVPAVSEVSQQETQVYVCTGKYSKRYHKGTKCKGMQSCKGETKKVALSTAKRDGKTACGFCYGKR